MEPETAAIIVSPKEVRLGSIPVKDPDMLIQRATEYATKLAAIINKQKLYSVIKPKNGKARKYVWCEGWTTLGALLGVVPVEDYCRELADNKGYEARVNLVRTSDGMVVGAASAEVRFAESKWRGRDSYALRSMSLTRATSKAFRLSFSWIMKLAGYEVLPAEEMEDGWEEGKAAQAEVATAKVDELTELVEARKRVNGNTLLCQWPASHNGFYALVTGNKAVLQTVSARFDAEMKAKYNEDRQGYIVAAGKVEIVRDICDFIGVEFCEVNKNPLAKENHAANTAKV